MRTLRFGFGVGVRVEFFIALRTLRCAKKNASDVGVDLLRGDNMAKRTSGTNQAIPESVEDIL
jgi:hypothetical protein